MKPGERVRLIKESAESLAARDFGEIQLVLGEFGFSTWDHDEATDRDYCIQAIRRGDDDSVGRLHEYLMGEDADPTAPVVTDHPWGDKPLRLFISHVHEDAHFVGDIKRVLAKHYGTDAFVAHDDIEPSKRWRDVIKAGLATCDALLALSHPRFHASQWCDQEVGWALGRNIPVIPIRRPDFDRANTRDGFLEEHQDFTLGPAGAWQVPTTVVPVLLSDARTHEKAFAAVVEAFVDSPNFNGTRWLWPLIEREPVIASEQLRRLEYAVQTNNQVYDATHEFTPVPDLVKALVEKFEPPAPPDPWAATGSWPSEPPF